MSRAWLLVALAVLPGCGAFPASQYRPRWAARNELVYGYDGGFVITSGSGDFRTKGPRYGGLTEYVACVPRASAHASAAERDGTAAAPLLWSGSILAVAGIGGVGGLAFYERDKRAFAGMLIGGFGLQLFGLLLVGAGVQSRVNAHGSALDAVNYYNDALGSRGRGCPR